MTDSPSEPAAAELTAGEEGSEAQQLARYAEELAAQVGGTGASAQFGSVHVFVERDSWIEAIRRARDEAGLGFLSWISAVDWSREVAVGDSVAEPDELAERYEVIARLSSVSDAHSAQFVTEVPKDDPSIDSLVPLFGGAEWHEREAAEMFGIDFRGHPNLTKLYLPDAFEGHPLRKSFPLLSREVKPWPGTVDVEDMPSTENVEAGEGAEQ